MTFHGSRGLGVLLAVFGVLAIAGPAPGARAAEFEIVPGGFTVRMLDAEGHLENRAGSHPDRIEIDFALHVEGTSARDLVFELPPGLGGNPDAVQTCSRELFESGEDCPSESQVGVIRFTSRMGRKRTPTGPYRRAPFGLLLQLHAAVGPLDLGTMSFRAAATVDGRTGRVTVSTDSLPAKIEGIPVRFQDIELSMDRPGLVRNPTSCRPASVDATVEASDGTVATATSPLVSSRS